MKETLEVINRMQADGVIGKYAIGGAVGATLYLDPTATFDVDVFVTLPTTTGSQLLSLTPIYEYLTKQGCEIRGEYIVIGSWPVQFLAPNNALEEEAISQARQAEVIGVRTWVMRAEHLVAIALQTGRIKDRERILHFMDRNAEDLNKLNDVLVRHSLMSKWEKFQKRYQDD
jgi:hypothetical protein